MTKNIASARLSKALEAPLPLAVPSLPSAFEDLQISVDRFCLLAGVEALGEMLAEEAGRPGPEAEALCGPRHARSAERRAHRWGTADSELAWQGGKIKVTRPRVRDLSGKEMKLASWQALSDPDLPRAWAMNLMALNVSTRKYRRAVRLPAGDLPAVKADATSKSAVSRRFVALTRKRLKAWLGSDLSAHDLPIIQIDGLKVGDHLLVAAIGVDGEGHKQVLGIAEGATESYVPLFGVRAQLRVPPVGSRRRPEGGPRRPSRRTSLG